MTECKMIVKTKKGFHFYYEFDNDLNYTMTYQNYGFDLRADGGVIIAPPSRYADEKGTVIEYKYTTTQTDNGQEYLGPYCKDYEREDHERYQ